MKTRIPIAYTPPRVPIRLRWHLVSIRTVIRALAKGWQWWADPRTAKPVLKSPTGQLYIMQYSPHAQAMVQRMDDDVLLREQ